jgi:hypothetical protein
VLGSYRASADVGDSLSFTFWGTDLSLVPAAGLSSGLLEVMVDCRRTQVDLSAPQISPAGEVLLVGDLTEGTHDARLTVAGSTGGLVAVDALVVRRSPQFLIRRGLSLLVLACLAVSLLYIACRHRARRGSPC